MLKKQTHFVSTAASIWNFLSHLRLAVYIHSTPYRSPNVIFGVGVCARGRRRLLLEVMNDSRYRFNTQCVRDFAAHLKNPASGLQRISKVQVSNETSFKSLSEWSWIFKLKTKTDWTTYDYKPKLIKICTKNRNLEKKKSFTEIILTKQRSSKYHMLKKVDFSLQTSLAPFEREDWYSLTVQVVTISIFFNISNQGMARNILNPDPPKSLALSQELQNMQWGGQVES